MYCIQMDIRFKGGANNTYKIPKNIVDQEKTNYSDFIKMKFKKQCLQLKAFDGKI